MEQSTDPSCQILPADNAALAKRHLANGEAALALRVCKAGLAENPKQLQLLLIGGIACRALGDLDQAYALITQATLLSPDNPSSHSLLGDILLLRKQPNAAIDALTLAIALNDR
jgi:protein O-GlcNAc transferase